MQSYIIKKKTGMEEETDTEIHRKDEELIKQYREKNSHGKEPRTNNISLIYVASSFVVLAMLAMGITVISNYDKMKEMEISINRLELTTEADEDTVQVLATEQTGNNTEAEQTVTDADITTGEQADINTEAEKPTVAENTEDITSEQILPAMTNGNPTYYTVKAGDTLSSIAYEAYGSVVYAEDIAKANKIDLEDNIYEGDEILLPAIDAR